MNIHKNARLTPLRREEMALAVIEGGFFKAHAARTYGVSVKIQMIMTRGLGPSGSRDPRLCKNRFMAFCVPFVVVANEEQRRRGLSVRISSRWRLPPDSVPSQIKNYNWIDFVLGLYDAYDAGCETSLMKNHLACCIGADIWPFAQAAFSERIRTFTLTADP